MKNAAVTIARLNAKSQDKAFLQAAALKLMDNPLLPAVLAMGLNYQAYQAGLYDNMPNRSALGGPVWFTIGKDQGPAIDTFARNEAFIMSVTMALALSPVVKQGLQSAGTTISALGPAAMAAMA